MNKYYIARDKDGTLKLFLGVNPTRDLELEGRWISEAPYCILPPNLYPELTWENEPIEVDIVFSSFLQRFIQFRDWLFSSECDGRLHAIRDKFEELKLDRDV